MSLMPQQDPKTFPLEQEGCVPFEALYDHQYEEVSKLQAKFGTGAFKRVEKGLPVDEDGLGWPCPGTRNRQVSTPEEFDHRLQKLSEAVRTIIECIGEDCTREGLKDTPERYARAMLFFTKGYEENIPEIINGAIFKEDHNEMVIVKDISIFSLCEHHIVPFMGKIHVGYIPEGRLIGLSKIARLAEALARRLQVQERLTKQLALVIFETLQPQGVGVIMESSHSCMMMRGVQKTDSTTTTSCMMGSLQTNANIRAEFLALLRGI